MDVYIMQLHAVNVPNNLISSRPATVHAAPLQPVSASWQASVGPTTVKSCVAWCPSTYVTHSEAAGRPSHTASINISSTQKVDVAELVVRLARSRVRLLSGPRPCTQPTNCSCWRAFGWHRNTLSCKEIDQYLYCDHWLHSIANRWLTFYKAWSKRPA